jgi:hypothetical protein
VPQVLPIKGLEIFRTRLAANLQVLRVQTHLIKGLVVSKINPVPNLQVRQKVPVVRQKVQVLAGQVAALAARNRVEVLAVRQKAADKADDRS